MHRVLRIGHRGAAGHAPENTLAAIHKGIGLGVDFVEIDVRRTADDVLVVLHDQTVDRTTNGTGRVDQLSLADLKKLDAGSGEGIPTLEDVLKAVAGRAGLMLELKVKGMAQQAVEAVCGAGFRDPVIYASFLHDELTQVRVVAPEAALLALFGRMSQVPVSRLVRHGPSHVGLWHETVTRRHIEKFHQAGLLVFVYTADSPGDIRRALSVGVDGVISNFPERIARQ